MRTTAPYPKCGFGFRVTSNDHGSANLVSSRLAEAYHIDTLSPAFIATPPISISSVRLRRMKISGDAHRTISSTAVPACVSKSSHQVARSSG